MLDQKQFSLALKQICDEKGISEKQVMETIESALAAAYRKDYGNKLQNIKVNFDPNTGDTKLYDVKTVVEDIPEETNENDDDNNKESNFKKEKDNPLTSKKNENFHSKEDEIIKKFNPKTEIQLKEAQKIKKSYKIGDQIITKLKAPNEYGRMAAQTAKQVIIQKLREAERETLYDNIKKKENQVVTGIIQRYNRGYVFVTIDKATAILPPEYQMKNERYDVGNQMKFYIVSVNKTIKGPEIILSRRNEKILEELFFLEIPEISSKIVEIKKIAREAGERSKVAVISNDKSIDPIGSCIGQRGNRIQTIINELNGEKIDIIEYDENIEKFIMNSLSPARISGLKIDEKNHLAIAKVKADQLSLAIGKGGQNVRLAAKLAEWKIDIEEVKENPPADEKKGKKEEKKDKNEKVEKEKKDGEKKKDKKEKAEEEITKKEIAKKEKNKIKNNKK
ncbi:MAG: transcription termination/antitermination protein NusA [Xanthomonadaceae bacterium]|nr:transcription termination/antitermination protein NusA [Rhodospirillaceae bacterium]NIA17972.1 transcription termination/antitermination protein NusA [Xanthomonadaceae bacterium]